MVMSVALAAFGVLGWADKANAFEALRSRSWDALDALWLLYAVAAVACLAAQVLAACAVVNFARLATAPRVWRMLAFAFYAVSVFFAAYSADMGAQVVLTSAHRSAYDTRKTERAALNTEIAAINVRLVAAGQRLGFDPATTVTARQNSALAAYNALTRVDQERLPQAQLELRDKPPIAREAQQPWLLALGVFAIFLGWAILEPWGYALAERGREPPRRPPMLVVEGGRDRPSPPAAQPRARPRWAGRTFVAGILSWWALQGQQSQAITSPPSNPVEPAQPVERVGDIVTERDLQAAAESLAAQHVGERQIAAQLSTRYNQFVSRWQVRKMLGRVAA